MRQYIVIYRGPFYIFDIQDTITYKNDFMSNYDQTELNKFAKLANEWWDPKGELKTLHRLNPMRMDYLRQYLTFKDQQIADIGCGGGILSESLAQAGAKVTGLDLNKNLIEVAKLHAKIDHLTIDYACLPVEKLAQEKPASFDAVICFEMLEHVPDPFAIVQACANLLKPGGQVFFSTINRNPKAYLFAIVAAEYILRLLPKNTHDYAKFIRPAELSAWCRRVDLSVMDLTGIRYNPLNEQVSLQKDISINYLLRAIKS